MQLTAEQLKTLATLADRWLAASPVERDELRAEAEALGAEFEHAFSVMISQLNADNSATLLPPLPDSLRNAAISEAKTTSSGTRDLDTAPPPVSLCKRRLRPTCSLRIWRNALPLW